MNPLADRLRKHRNVTAFASGVAACCAWILSLPVFPSEDGPVHVYYATVMTKLLSGSHGPLSDAFRIRHLLPPYSLYYYMLIGLLQMVPAVAVEQLAVCIVVVTMAFGFRFMCCAAGDNGRWTSFLILPLLLNWPLFMGFENYCLSVGLCFWAMGVWFGQARFRRVVFLVLVVLIVLTHPVPLLALGVLCVIDLTGRRVVSPAGLMAGWRHDLLTLAGACGCMSYVLLYTEKSKVRENLLQHVHPLVSVMKYSTLYGLGLFARISAATLLYTGLLLFPFFLSMVLALRSFVKRDGERRWRATDALLLATVGLVVVLPFLPDTMNGGFYFNMRFLILMWCGAIAAASGGAVFGLRLRVLLMSTGFIALSYTLLLAQMRIAPEARRAAEAERAPVVRSGENAILLPATDYEADPTLRFRPLEWSAVRYFRRAGDVMQDAPFLDMSTMPIDTRRPQLEGTVVPGATNDLLDLLKRSRRDPEWGKVLFAGADLVVFHDDFRKSSPSTMDQTLHEDGKPQMHCTPRDWLYFCR